MKAVLTREQLKQSAELAKSVPFDQMYYDLTRILSFSPEPRFKVVTITGRGDYTYTQPRQFVSTCDRLCPLGMTQVTPIDSDGRPEKDQMYEI